MIISHLKQKSAVILTQKGKVAHNLENPTNYGNFMFSWCIGVLVVLQIKQEVGNFKNLLQIVFLLLFKVFLT